MRAAAAAASSVTPIRVGSEALVLEASVAHVSAGGTRGVG